MSSERRDVSSGSAATVLVDGLRKRFGATVAVDGVSFAVQPGEAFGLLGPNGAGKTTTLSLITGLLRPDAGKVWVGGHSLRRAPRRAQRLLGVVPQGIALYPELSARQNLNYFAKLRGLAKSERRRQIEELLEIAGLAQEAGRPVRGFSGGMKRRLNLAIGLLGRPQALLLDEPTVGIDAQARRELLVWLRRLADSGVAIIYTSHYVEEVEQLCRRVAIIDRGRVIAQGPVDELRALAGDRVVLRVPVAVEALPAGLDLSALRQAVAVPVEATGGELRFTLPAGSGQAPALLNTLHAQGVPLDGIRLETPSLETVFLSLTGKALNEPGSGDGRGERGTPAPAVESSR